MLNAMLKKLFSKQSNPIAKLEKACDIFFNFLLVSRILISYTLNYHKNE